MIHPGWFVRRNPRFQTIQTLELVGGKATGTAADARVPEGDAPTA